MGQANTSSKLSAKAGSASSGAASAGAVGEGVLVDAVLGAAVLMGSTVEEAHGVGLEAI
jgi:hypothetical protein